ncbi:hypothetical protein HCG49_16760 [Arenibacter sp. 6A1]|uniref:hypothetical protein n=1 Tax=Arenibacter sp. 6A1 TaxID=2720391 RepID=UPI00144845D5|nr:hypothetical protein [Arenibacter sp. 6A1]NKI28206.1 hypothetical protein [Arenibacter sp. 6A1]
MKSESEILYNQFSRAKQQQKYIWISSMVFVMGAFIAVLVFLFFWSKNVVVIKENGQVVSAVVQSREATFSAMAKHHLDQAFHFANSFDRFTYKKNQAKTLFLMDSKSANRLWSVYEREGVFADVLSKGTLYEARILPESIQVVGDQEPYRVQFQGIIKVDDGGFITTYLAMGKGKLIYYTPSYPENSTGFFVTDYVQKVKLYDKEQD